MSQTTNKLGSLIYVRWDIKSKNKLLNDKSIFNLNQTHYANMSPLGHNNFTSNCFNIGEDTAKEARTNYRIVFKIN